MSLTGKPGVTTTSIVPTSGRKVYSKRGSTELELHVDVLPGHMYASVSGGDTTLDVIVTVPLPDVVKVVAQPVAITATASSPAARTALLPGRDFTGLVERFLDCVAQN